MAEIVSKNPVNDPSPKSVNSRSTFALGQNLAQTERFGEITPRFALEVVKGDRLPYSFAHELRTFTLGAPFMGQIHRNEDAFFVPAEAILPLNWDKILTNPLHGDDVDASQVGCTVPAFVKNVRTPFMDFLPYIELALEAETPDAKWILEAYIKFVLGTEMIFSNGSLPSLLGAHLCSLLEASDYVSIDKYVDYFFGELSEIVSYFRIYDGSLPNEHVIVRPDLGDYSQSGDWNLHQFLEYARDGYSNWTIDVISFAAGKSVADLDSFYDDLSDFNFTVPNEFPLNLARFFAYQIVCAHFYTNDKIDYVYDANMYRQNVYDSLLAIEAWSMFTNFNDTFTLNGSQFRYDYLSAFNFVKAMTGLEGAFDPDKLVGFSHIMDYLRLIFGFNRSLRFVDYFTGSKSQPLAVGDVNVGVVANEVNVVDITRNIQRQRFLNAVNRAGRRFGEYLKDIFGGATPAPDYHNPFFLSHTRDYVGHEEIENTADGQRDANSVTSIMRSQSNRFQFEFNGDRPGILIGVAYYDIERYYSRGVEKLMTHVDRYDMFNPFMQFTGDQLVEGYERDVRATSGFSYTQRYMEYKQRYSQAAGGFVEFLPGWIFLAEENTKDSEAVISPSFIRSKPSELDPFYTSLTGFSLASYFHFIVINRNMCDGSRPMAYSPSIL